MQKLLTLLQINDSMFPIGSFTHSYGLESYIDAQLVKDTETARKYAENMLKYNLFYNDAAFLNKIYDFANGRKVWKKLVELDDFITALKAPYEIRQASHKLAIRFLKTAQSLKPYPFCQKYLDAIQSGEVVGHYPIAFGLYAQLSGIEKKDALSAFYYNSLNGIVTNCAKIIPISQMHSQKILFDLQDLIEELVEKQEDLDENLVGLCCIGQEIKCMQHEKLYTRIYIS
ncbi:Urease accessory protein UreF [Candidatus Ornithobacterium hominis]|uniref:Urease accessory protein UreF n=1 Tax=Candidatus Ornithobacterium hominis TaxID=2497989 RepID=A0A383U429_9FLAO|nr:urease accessory protein UreF [Candidatus Ornithobacterium hominis]MCT7905024.1 urease accessory protein UreF [Candidatus Ornithobacterium hominis]CAI9429761.1 Urease accessory protein UreF [Candidatus Ornithobacterium hominis]SZD73803.1 Urease accessory protein UreF [Candidatus Ornithobacterium hominis]SZD74139.1 Urease accessory protein UreF [Candidatus Ornithobacterium hominis]